MAINSNLESVKKLQRPSRLFCKFLMIRRITERSPFPHCSSQFQIFQESSTMNPNIKSTERTIRNSCSVKKVFLKILQNS